MHARKLVEDTLLEMERDMERALDGLTPEELSWRPADWANSIGFSLWHLTRAEDVWLNKWGQGVPQVLEAGGWAGKWGIPEEDTGAGYDEAKLAAFPTPPLEELLIYYRGVRQRTLAYLKGLTPERLDDPLKVAHPRLEEYSIGRMFGHLVSEIAQHVGHMRYLRGLKRGLDR